MTMGDRADDKPEFRFGNAGLFISRGRGRHVTRVIDSHELIYVKSGVLWIQEDGVGFEVRRGEYLLLYPGRTHGGTRDYPPNLAFYWGHFHCQPDALAAIPQTGRVARENWMGEYYSLLLDAQRESDNQAACSLIMQLLLNEAAQTPRDNANGSPRHLAEAARRIITLDYTDELTTATIARELHCNPDYLGRLFRHAFGCTMADELNRVRCAHAADLLRNGTSTIKEIAWHCGYNDDDYFRRRFQRLYAMTPAQYRQLHIGGHVNTSD